MEAEEFTPTLGRRPDGHEDALGLEFHSRRQVNPVSTDVDVATRPLTNLWALLRVSRRV